LDDTIKKQFDSLCAEFGMSASTAFNIYARTVVRQRKIPFEGIGKPEPLIGEKGKVSQTPKDTIVEKGDKMRKRFLGLIFFLALSGIIIFVGVKYRRLSFKEKTSVQINETMEDENISNNIALGGELAERNGKIYFSNADDDWCLYVRNLENDKDHKLNNERSDNINVGDGWIFYRDIENHCIVKISVDSGEKKIIYNGIIDNLIYNNGYLYFLEENEGKQCIKKIDSDGFNKKIIFFDDSIGNLVLQNDYFYYYNTNDGMIKKVKKDGTFNCNVFKAQVDFFVVNCNGIYFTDKENQKISHINFDGNNESIITNSYADYINIWGDWLYYYTVNDCMWRNEITTNKDEKYIYENILRFYITENAILYDYIEEINQEEHVCQKIIKY
jgi:antitoxin component of RelBE/YafQ-DinJ toxin-antitoxin module